MPLRRAAARAGDRTPSFVPVSRSRSSTSAAARRSSNPRARLRPGAHTEMQLAGPARARVDRGPSRSLLRRRARADSLSRRRAVRRARRRRRGARADRGRVAGARRHHARSGTCYSPISDRAKSRWQFRRESANHSSAARGIRIVIGPVIMDAGPNMSRSRSRGSGAAPIGERASINCCGTSQLICIDATDRRHLVEHPHRAAASTRAGAQRRAERNHQHDAAAIGAAGSRARLRGLLRAGAGRGPTGDARSVVRCAQRARRLDLPAARGRRERRRRCCSRPSGLRARRRR